MLERLMVHIELGQSSDYMTQQIASARIWFSKRSLL